MAARTCPNCSVVSAEVLHVKDYATSQTKPKSLVMIICHNCKAHTHAYASEDQCVDKMATEMTAP